MDVNTMEVRSRKAFVDHIDSSIASFIKRVRQSLLEP
jgi:hypothetical protein